MANIALQARATTNRRIDPVVKPADPDQMTLPAAEAITAGMAVRLVPSSTGAGKFTKANASDATEGLVWGIALRTVAANETVTAYRGGVLDGYVLDGVNYGAPLYLSDTDGRIADAAGTQNVLVGHVVPGTATTLGTAYDKLLKVEIAGTESLAAFEANYVLRRDMTAASVDENLFVADRAYQVIDVKEVHSVVGGSGAVVTPRKITDTSAPGAAASATVVELTVAAIDLTTTINTVQDPALSATPADLLVAAGDRIALNFAGTLTNLVGTITIVLKAI